MHGEMHLVEPLPALLDPRFLANTSCEVQSRTPCPPCNVNRNNAVNRNANETCAWTPWHCYFGDRTSGYFIEDSVEPSQLWGGGMRELSASQGHESTSVTLG